MKPDLRFAPMLLAGALACAACGDGPPARTGGDQSATGGGPHPNGAARGVVPIAFEAKKAGSRAFSFPLVEGKVNGQPTRFILDTGAVVHAIDTPVAAAAQLASPAKASSISIDGWGTLPEHAVAVRDLPASIRAHGIGGIIAPQLLVDAPDQAVVVDLVNLQLRMRPKSTAGSAMADLGPSLSGAGRKLCPADADGLPGLGLAIAASVDGEPTWLAIDTGASRTMLVEGSKPAARAITRPVLGRTMSAEASAETATSIYGGVPFVAGAWTSTVDVGVSVPHRPPPCGVDGRLGMDVLQHCAVAISADEMLVSCRR
ncbi:MAG: hypothetical protein JWO86_8113 [Myxococcaceae bacterium]|nr:hypothetical protein [Myxococcaceae bacterium]